MDLGDEVDFEHDSDFGGNLQRIRLNTMLFAVLYGMSINIDANASAEG